MVKDIWDSATRFAKSETVLSETDKGVEFVCAKCNHVEDRLDGFVKIHGNKKFRKISCGNFYINFNFNAEGKIELLLPNMGRSGNCNSHWIEVNFNVFNELLKILPEQDALKLIIKCLGGDEGIGCSQIGNPLVNEVKSCSQGIVQMLKHYVKKEEEK